MKKWTMLFAMYIVCSGDKGLSRTLYRNAHNIFYAQNCLVWESDQVDGQVASCHPADECVIKEGTVPAAGSPSEDYLKQESTETVKQ